MAYDVDGVQSVDRSRSPESVTPQETTMQNKTQTDALQRRNSRVKDSKRDSNQDSKKSIEQALSEFEEGLGKLNDLYEGDMKIEINKEAHMKVVKIIDSESGEVMREIPPKEMVELAKNINELIGMLFDKMA